MAKKTLDFSNVKEGSDIRPKRLPAGDYSAVITKVIDKPAKDGTDMWCFVIQPEEHRGATYGYYCKLDPDQLWKLRNLLMAAGVAVPKKRIAIDPDRLTGKRIGITLVDDEYEGKEKSSIDSVFPADEIVGDDLDDDEDEGDSDSDEGDNELELDEEDLSLE